MFTKICASTNINDARLAAALGATAVGFVFARSRRQVSAEQAAAIVDELPVAVEKIGVFATGDPFEVEHYAACAGLTGVQLHSSFDRSLVTAVAREFGGRMKIIQAVPYAVDREERAGEDKRFAEELRAAAAEPAVWAVLVDAAKSGRSGGLGVAFDWAHVGALVRKAVGDRRDAETRIILAGGLRPDNVREAIAQFAPWGVDVASGVEAAPGMKDAAKVAQFLAAAREGDVAEPREGV